MTKSRMCLTPTRKTLSRFFLFCGQGSGYLDVQADSEDEEGDDEEDDSDDDETDDE